MNEIRYNDDFYPDGIEFCAPNALKSNIAPLVEQPRDSVVKIAIFDMDGTSINTSSPVVLVKRLAREKKITPLQSFMILCWGVAYKYQLPRKNNPVRERVFSAFKGVHWTKVNSYLQNFFEEEIATHIRDSAKKEMERLHDLGIVVVMVSASFDSVIATCMTKMPINFGVASLMQIDDSGNYTNIVEGIPPEGPDKKTAFETFANANFGEGRWEVEYSFGDHLSDREILQLAKNPVAVTPDKQLENLAKESGWKIANW